jgi:hypothetical protein
LTLCSLASRQRKKKHTEDLEVREKSFTQQINMLEKDNADLSIECQRREDERQILIHRVQEYQRAIESLQEEIRNLKIQHNEETSQLRKRVNILTDQVAMEAPAMSAAPSSTGFTDFNAEMEALNMGSHDWEDFFVVDDGMRSEPFDDMNLNSRAEHVHPSPTLEKRPSSSTIVPSPTKRQSETSHDQPLATGLLFMLLLCGAFVASKPPSARPSDLPNMPPEVQAAAPTVLKDLLAEAGQSMPPSTSTNALQHHEREPRPSPMAYISPRVNNRLDQMHTRLITPSRQQEIDQAFSLTTAQYASITHMNYPGNYGEPIQPPEQAQRPRRSQLSMALANMQQEYQQAGKAEVYSRSLLWDQLSGDVVKQFREVVRDHEELENRQKQRSAQGYKVEP